MKKFSLQIILCITIFFISASNHLFSQTYPWEPSTTINLNLYSYSGGTFNNDIAYDNYGVHFVGIQTTGVPQRQLSYYHLDNNGNILDPNINFESNVHGVGITSYKGKVYIILRVLNTFKVYTRINGVSNLQFRGSFTPSNYGYPSQNERLTHISLTPITILNEDLICFTWDNASYSEPPNIGIGTIGFAVYKDVDASLNFLTSIDNGLTLPQFYGGMSPQITSSTDQLHIVYSHYTDNLNYFVNRDINKVNFQYLDPVLTPDWGEPIPGINYIPDPQTRANIIFGNNQLFLLSNLLYQSGDLRINTLFKIKQVGNLWSVNRENLALNNANLFKYPALSIDNNTNRVGTIYSKYVGSSTYKTYSQEYDLVQGTLLTPEELFSSSNNFLHGGSLSNSPQGDYALFTPYVGQQNYVGIRRPRALTGQITYNTLLTGNEYFNAPTPPYCRTNGADIEALANSTTRIKANTRIFIDVGDLITFRANSCVVYEPNSEIFPIERLIYETDCIVWENLACNRTYPGGLIKFASGLNSTVNNGGFMVIDENSTLELGDNTTLTFDGNNSYLKLFPNSNVKLGTNSSIKFKNGAHINANGATFNGTISSTLWNGIKLENSGYDTIMNCTFNNAQTAISITNNPNSSYIYMSRTIKNNVFNFVYASERTISITNGFNITIDGNTFNEVLDNNKRFAIYIHNSNFVEDGGIIGAGGIDEINPMVRIINNNFNSNYLSMVLRNSVSALSQFYVTNNTFAGCSKAIMGIKMAGDIKYNRIYGSGSNPIILAESNPNLYGNNIQANGTAISSGYSYPRLAPIRNANNQFVWYGGKNRLFSNLSGNNIMFGYGYAFIDYGSNTFEINATNSFHLFGRIDDPIIVYLAKNNCWVGAGGIPKCSIYNNVTNNVYIDYLGPTACREYEVLDNVISEMGPGLFDTLFITESDNNAPIESDEILYNNANKNVLDQEYSQAITNYKNLITNYSASSYLCASVNEMYECYVAKDTSGEESYTYALYNDLKSHLENRILVYSENEEFVSLAYEITLRCAARIEEFQGALEGYEFISLNHPDPFIRLIASWEYADIELILDTLLGNGGGVSNKYEINNDEFKMEGIKELEDREPIKEILRKSYTKIENKKSEDLKSPVDKISEKESRNTNNDKDIKDKLKRRALENIRVSKNWSEKQLERRRNEDLEMILQLYTNKGDKGNMTTVVENYKLSQNYPNPFNPITTISYKIPNDGLVKIKVYDITGKEVAVLVNEFKNIGTYNITFNASNFPSGIYFYKLETGNFIDTKRMILIK